MDYLHLDLNSQQNWGLVLTEEKTAVAVDEFSFWPIPPFLLNFLFSQRIIAVFVSTGTPNSTRWRFGGEIQPRITGADGIDTILFNTRLTLGAKRLITLPKLDSYKLLYSPPRYFQNFSLKVWHYIGDENDELLGKLNQLQSML